MGYISVAANSYKDVSNLPYTSINSYVAFVQDNGINAQVGTGGWSLGQPEKLSNSTLRVWTQDDLTKNVNWITIGY